MCRANDVQPILTVWVVDVLIDRVLTRDSLPSTEEKVEFRCPAEIARHRSRIKQR